MVSLSAKELKKKKRDDRLPVWMWMKTNSEAELVAICFRKQYTTKKALCYPDMVLQQLPAGEHMSRVTASKCLLIIAEDLENNWAMCCPLDRDGQEKQ